MKNASSTESPDPEARAAPRTHPDEPLRKSRAVPLSVIGIVLSSLLGGAWALARAEQEVNDVPLSAAPKEVAAVRPKAATYQATRRYVGTLRPWQQAGVGPQLASGFVGSVLVRPGAIVKRGDVLATLDCRNASASSQAVAAQARALEARQRAAAKESARVQEMKEGGFVSDNELEQSLAQTEAAAASIQALQATLQSKQLEVNDCVMRAPFAGEIAQRMHDPGAFVRPGTSIVTVIDRDVVRLVADVPEADFAAVAPGTSVRIRLLATGQERAAVIARRSPSADVDTRTIHVEIDLNDARRQLPVGTTAQLELDVGTAEPALELPLIAATIRGKRATLFVVRDGKVEKAQLDVLGERGASVLLRPALRPDDVVVTQGKSQLSSGDAVRAHVEQES